MIKSKQLAKAIYELAKNDTDHLEDKVLAFLEKQKLLAQIPAVLFHLEKIAEQENESKSIIIETAHNINKDTVQKIKQFMAAKQGENKDLGEILKVKKELIAGFRAKQGGSVYDSSIMTGLQKLEEAIIN